ncbi:ricin-type beta-trefoil lectin domain protein [Dactylosporangium darangshiense]
MAYLDPGRRPDRTGPTGTPGAPVPATLVAAIGRSARSCPTLTAPRLAGQLMTASGFDVEARTSDGGLGVAGLTDELWQQWIPWPDAPRMDATANIAALAHHMCDLAGKLRQSGANDVLLWKLALAAHQAGLPTVLATNATPVSAARYVDTVVEYATWYARQPEFRGSVVGESAADAATVSADPRPIPDEFVDAVVSAGTRCPAISAPRIAAQLMASSGFEPNMLGGDGGQGIAQFRPAVWQRYGTAGQSPWDPMAAIPTLGRAMCGLTEEMSKLAPDPYPVALSTFWLGLVDVQESSSAPDLPNAQEYASRVLQFVDYYAQFLQLGGESTSGNQTSPGANATPSTPAGSVSSAPTSRGPGGGSPPATTVRPGGGAAPSPSVTGYMIWGYQGRCLTVPGGVAKDGVQLEMRDCTGGSGQWWTPADNGSLRSLGMCMDLAGADDADGTNVQLVRCNGGWAQRFAVNSSHDLVNTVAKKCVDVRGWNSASGAKLQLWSCTGGDNQKWFIKY